ncbi:PhzF family phenazine biosynthesis protein [Streptomyces sp. CRN 30]|uniref:PhzF family phenazine biosynthesis protein n=1 Tax=Streptomyces sp. CRN 30 TaxID=3075613 RepID=UPI002A7F9C99|nr:PhzF family phenazine biosynthesis protein [Streptomyces sp. CRN 30]
MVDLRSVLRLAAFPATSDGGEPTGGNPAGVVLDARGMSDAEMQAVAAEVGYAETAFVVGPPDDGRPRHVGMRYFSPTAEVPFCGHATVATAVALARRTEADAFVFETPAGDVRIDLTRTGGEVVASFTSVPPRVEPIGTDVLARLLDILGLTYDDFDPVHPPRLAFAGNTHPVLVLADQDTFDGFTFAPDVLRTLMDEQRWMGTVTVLKPLGEQEFEARNLFPVGTITEDPATGSAAASVGAYLRDTGLLPVPGTLTIHQGRHVGHPSLLRVAVPAEGGITVSGTATVITA